MSFEAMAWAVKKDCKTASQKLVLLLLADHSNGYTGQCNPSHKRLAKACCMSVSSLKSQIKYLADEGYLTIERKTSKGVSLANQYWLSIERKDTVETDKKPPNPDYSRGSKSDGGQNLTGAESDGGGSESGYKPVIEPKDQEKEQQQEPEKNPIVVFNENKEEKKTEQKIDLSELPKQLHKPALAIIKKLAPPEQTKVIRELAIKISDKRVTNPMGYLRRLVQAETNGTFTITKSKSSRGNDNPTSAEIMANQADKKRAQDIQSKKYIEEYLAGVDYV